MGRVHKPHLSEAAQYIYFTHPLTHARTHTHTHTHTHTGIHLTPAADATCTPREAIAEFAGGGQPVLLDDSLSINLLARVTSSALKEIQHGTQFTCITSTKVQILTRQRVQRRALRCSA